MPNKSDRYVKEMNGLIFSDDIKERIMSNIIRQKKKNKKIFITSIASLFIFFIYFIVVRNIDTPNENKSEFLCEEDIEKLGCVSSVIDVRIDVGYNIDNLEIRPKQMVILNMQNIQDAIDSFEIKGQLIGDNREYSLGYIVDKNYTEVLSDCTEEFINNQVDIKEGTEYSFYIINCSDKVLTFSGNIFVNQNDLVYRDYGSEALQVEENCRIIINLSGLYNSYNIEGIYIFNYITQQTIRREFSDMIIYESEHGGVYLIYALTDEGERIGLSEYVGVESSIENGNYFIEL